MVVSGKDPFLSSVLKAKYFPNSTFWKCSKHGSKSVFWSFIQNVRQFLFQNSIFQIHQGNINIWTEPWCQGWDSIHSHIQLPVSVNPIPNQVKDLWYPSTRDWNIPLVQELFDLNFQEFIFQTPIVHLHETDKLIWKPARIGICSSKEAYNFISRLNNHQLPDQGSRSISAPALDLINRIWKNKKVQPKLKAFMWRLIRNAVATAERASRYSTNINNLCNYCGQKENDMHLFFHCSLPRAVWFSANPSLRADLLPNIEHGLQDILPYIFPPHTDDSHLISVITTLWYIWRARNDNRFNNRTWTVQQVHFNIQAEISVITNSLSEKSSMNDDHNHLSNQDDTGEGSPQGEQQDTTTPSNTNNISCYVDAAIPPEHLIVGTTPAGIGIYITGDDQATRLNIKIQAQIMDGVNPLMAEGLAMELATKITTIMGLQSYSIFTDSQILVEALKPGSGKAKPPPWRLKPTLSTIQNQVQGHQVSFSKIKRTLNVEAHKLARKARQSFQQQVFTRCSNCFHNSPCELLHLLCTQSWGNFRLLYVSCE